MLHYSEIVSYPIICPVIFCICMSPSSIFQTVESMFSIIFNKDPLYFMKNHFLPIWKHTPQCNCHQIIPYAYSSVQLWFFYFFQYIYGYIWSIINYITTAFTLLLCWNFTVIDECVLCIFFENRGIDNTDSYINTIIHY